MIFTIYKITNYNKGIDKLISYGIIILLKAKEKVFMNLVEKNREKNRKYIEKLQKMSDEELCAKFNCKPEQVCRGNYVAKLTRDKVCPFVVVLGYVNAAASQLQSLGDLEFIGLGDMGDGLDNEGLILSNSEIKDFGKVKRIYGDLMIDPANKYIKSFGEIEYIGGNCYLNRTTIKNMGKVKEVGGILSIDKSNVKSLQGLKKAGKIFAYEAYKLEDWGDTLEEVGDVEFSFLPLTQRRSDPANTLSIHSDFYKNFKRNASGVFERKIAKSETNVDL